MAETLWLVGLLQPWLGALLVLLLPRRWAMAVWPVALASSLLTAAALTASHVLQPAGQAMAVLARLDWLPAFGWTLLIVRDGVTVLFGLVTAWISALVTLFAWRYLPHADAEVASPRRPAVFYALLAAFTGAMLSLVSSGNLIQLYLGWELTGVASFLLIGYWYHLPAARQGALRSLLMTTAGGITLLIGLLGLGWQRGTWDLPALLAATPGSADLTAVTALIVVGALAKSAQFPFIAWLPAAMAAPTPVSAFLHSSALVAAGVYLLARLFPLLGTQPAWHLLLTVTGVIGALVGGLLALRQQEMKALLAYSTVSQYAFIFMAFGLASVTGVQAGLYAFFVHSAIKAGLFLVAGAVTSVTGQTRLDRLGGLVRTHPGLTALAVVLALSLGGLPILGGFYYKEEILHAAAEQDAWLLFGAMQVAGMLTLIYMLRFLDRVFWGQRHWTGPVRPLPVSMGLPIVLLAAVPVATGIEPGWMNAAILDPAIASSLQMPAPLTVELSVGMVFLLSLAVLSVGVLLWRFGRHRALPAWLSRLPNGFSVTGGRLPAFYDGLAVGALALHGGRLRLYLRRILVAALTVSGLCWLGVPWPAAAVPEPFDLSLTLMVVVSLVAATATLWLDSHIAATIALGISGYALAGVFALMHAPDVALAQVLVETLATLSIVLALRQSRHVQPNSTHILVTGGNRTLRWLISLGVGGAVGAVTYGVARHPPADSVGAWYAAEAYARTGMADLVTAILADFRALDTAIEILVFAAAALAIVGLYRTGAARHG